jgi:proteasome lid subunit RPN8/RPN11
LRATSHEPCGAGPEAILLEFQLAEIFRQAEAGYPEEICGMVVGWRNAPKTLRVRQVRNIANQEPQRDTAGVPRDARTAYKMDPLEQLRVLREADQRGWEVVAFYHSHPDHDAYFSAMDRDRALASGREPIWPGAAYLVISVVARRGRAASYYSWDADRRGFVERSVPPPRRSRVISAGIGPTRKALCRRRLLRYRKPPVRPIG